MTFLHLSLLAGVGAIAAPIVLHLIMRQQPRHMEFPALRFIQARRDSNRRRLRFRQLLLLLLRCAALALLAIALARPSIMASGGFGSVEAPVAAALVFDTSPRMLYRQRNETRLELACQTGLWLIEQLPAESDVAVIDSRTEAAVFSVNLGAARDRVRKLAPHADAQPLAQGLADSVRLVRSSDKARREVYIFTDATRGSWTGPAVAEAQKRIADAADVSFYLIDLGSTDPQNFSLDDLRLSGQSLSKNSPLRIETNVGCLGVGGERTIELLLDEAAAPAVRAPAAGPPAEAGAPVSPAAAAAKPAPRGRQSVTLAGGQSEQIEFRIGGLSPGVHQGLVKISGEDGLAVDDVRYFTVDVKPPWRVLLAAPPPAREYTLFLSEALSPYRLRVQKEAAFLCETVTLDELAHKPLDPYAAVCLVDPTPLPSAVWQRLTGFASGGGGVAIFLGRNVRSAEEFNDQAALELLPGPLVRQWKAGDREVCLAPESLDHPLLAKFRPLSTSVPWDGFPVFRHWQLGSLAEGANVIIPYSNNLPALVERQISEGRSLTLTTPVSDSASQRDLWNTLPTGDEPWPFVMLANEMLYYLVGSNSTQLNYRIGEVAIVPLPRSATAPVCLVTTPTGETIRQSIDERRHSLAFTATDDVGSFRARAGGEQNGLDLGFSVNLPADRTSLTRADEAEIKAVFGKILFRVAHNREEIDRSMNTARAGQELYPLLILLVALVLGGELALANRFYRQDYRADEVKVAATNRAAEIEATKREPAGAASR